MPMSYCVHCGAALAGAMQFCGNCGNAVSAPAPTPSPAPQQAFQPAPGGTQVRPRAAAGTSASSAGGATPGFDPQQVLALVLRGNWIVAISVALTAVLVSGLLATVLGLVAKPADIGVDNALTFIAVLMTSAFGADLVANSASDAFDGGGGVGLFPLTITLCTLAATVFVFRRATASYPRALDAIADGVRAAVLAAVPMAAIALIFRADNDKLGSTSLHYYEASGSGNLLDIGASWVGSFFLTVLVLSVVLAVATLGRRDWWGPRIAKAHDWLAAPLAGFVSLALLLPVAGAIGVAAILLFGDDNTSDLNTDGWMTLIGLTIAYLGNIGFGVMTLGTGGRLGVQAEGSGRIGGARTSGSYEEFHRLAWFTADNANQPHESGLWVSVAVVPLVLLIAVLVVAHRSARREAVFGNILRFAAGLLVGIPLLVRLSSLHAAGNVSSGGRDVVDGLIDGSARGSAFLGAAGVDVTLELASYALVIGLILAALTGVIDVDRLRGQAAQVARTMSAAGAPGTASAPTAPPHPQQSHPAPDAFQRPSAVPPAADPASGPGQQQP